MILQMVASPAPRGTCEVSCEVRQGSTRSGASPAAKPRLHSWRPSPLCSPNSLPAPHQPCSPLHLLDAWDFHRSLHRDPPAWVFAAMVPVAAVQPRQLACAPPALLRPTFLLRLIIPNPSPSTCIIHNTKGARRRGASRTACLRPTRPLLTENMSQQRRPSPLCRRNSLPALQRCHRIAHQAVTAAQWGGGSRWGRPRCGSSRLGVRARRVLYYENMTQHISL